jgi:hypothetical protein
MLVLALVIAGASAVVGPPVSSSAAHPLAGKHRSAATSAVAMPISPLLKVTDVGARTIGALDVDGRAVVVEVMAATTYQEEGATASLADVQPGVLIGVQASASDPSGATLQASSIVIVPEQMAGVVTVAAGGTLDVTGFDGATRALELDQRTVLERAGHRIASADLMVGQAIAAEGFNGSDGALHATRVAVQLPHLSGTVSASDGGTFTIAGLYGATARVTLAADAIVRTSDGSSIDASDGSGVDAGAIVDGAQVDAEGFLDAGGSAMTAERVTILSGQICPPVPDPSGGPIPVDPCVPPPGVPTPPVPCNGPVSANGTMQIEPCPAPPPPGCGSAASGGQSGVAGAPPAAMQGGVTIPPCPPPPVTGAGVTLTQADNGRTVTLAVGQRLTLALSGAGGLSWDAQVDDPAVLAREVVPLPSDVQGIFVAAAPGTTTLRAVGTPTCPTGAACPQLAAVFGVTVVVQ